MFLCRLHPHQKANGLQRCYDVGARRPIQPHSCHGFVESAISSADARQAKPRLLLGARQVAWKIIAADTAAGLANARLRLPARDYRNDKKWLRAQSSILRLSAHAKFCQAGLNNVVIAIRGTPLRSWRVRRDDPQRSLSMILPIWALLSIKRCASAACSSGNT